MTTVRITEVDGLELHKHYPGQLAPQDCYIELDSRDGALSAEANAQVGNGVPFAVYHGHVQRWRIPALRAERANALMEEILPSERVVASYSSKWDGHNHLASYSEDAQAAIDEIEAACNGDWRDEDCVQIWDASEWLGGIGGAAAQCRDLGITAETTDAELEAIEEQIETDARGENVDVLTGLSRHLSWLRSECEPGEVEDSDEV